MALSLFALFTLIILSLPIRSSAYFSGAPSISTPSILAPILSNLGYQELAVASPSLSLHSGQFSPPITIFAASDDSIRSCSGDSAACSVSRLLKEHVVPGLFSHHYLSKLSFGTKLETVSPNRCLTVTSTIRSDGRSNSTVKIFIDGVEITHPDLYNDGKLIVHGIQGFIAPLSPFSCITDKATTETRSSAVASTVMLRDAIIRLRSSGYSVLALAMKIKSPELVTLQNMTVFALDDVAIFNGGGHAYIHEVRFHIVPNRLMMYADLMKLPEGTVLPTLIKGDNVVITQRGVGKGGLRINYVPVRMADVLYNSKIAVHSLYFPFPHLYFGEMRTSAVNNGVSGGPGGGVCGVGKGGWDCEMGPTASPAYGSSSAAAVRDVHGDDSL